MKGLFDSASLYMVIVYYQLHGVSSGRVCRHHRRVAFTFGDLVVFCNSDLPSLSIWDRNTWGMRWYESRAPAKALCTKPFKTSTALLLGMFSPSHKKTSFGASPQPNSYLLGEEALSTLQLLVYKANRLDVQRLPGFDQQAMQVFWEARPIHPERKWKLFKHDVVSVSLFGFHSLPAAF